MTNYIGTLAKPMRAQNGSLSQRSRVLFGRFMNWRRRRRDQAALLRQPDYLLRDIGIERHEIESAVQGRHRIFHEW